MPIDELPQSPDSALSVQPGVQQPPSINARLVGARVQRVEARLTPKQHADAIVSGDRFALSRAITLIESSREADQLAAREIVELCLPHSGNSVRVGVTGVPGVGKSTLIEALGVQIVESEKKRLAVLAIDPSSQMSQGSILGDKSRMAVLGSHPMAFVRPSPSRGSLGGVARKTREAMVLCEAAGYEVVLVETVGVGQSETAVRSMVDCFLLLMLAGGGDELQGIKRGIMEMADVLAITKCDGENRVQALVARSDYESALRLFPPPPSGWRPPVVLCSAKTGEGIEDLWRLVSEYVRHCKDGGWFDRRRESQALQWMADTIEAALLDRFHDHLRVREALPELKERVVRKEISAHRAAEILLEAYDRREGH